MSIKLDDVREDLLKLKKELGATVIVFGSVLKHGAVEWKSDIDILVLKRIPVAEKLALYSRYGGLFVKKYGLPIMIHEADEKSFEIFKKHVDKWVML